MFQLLPNKEPAVQDISLNFYLAVINFLRGIVVFLVSACVCKNVNLGNNFRSSSTFINIKPKNLEMQRA